MKRNEIGFFNDFDLIDSFFNDDEFFNFRPMKKEVVPFRCDVIENENDYSLVLDVPGFKKNEIHLSVDNGYLTIEAEKQASEEDRKKKFVRRERFYESYKRTFYVGNVTDQEIKAKMEEGVLTISVPKEKEEIITKKNIEIE